MEFYINDEKLDFSLENEKTLSDVLKQIQIWIQKSNHFIERFIIDGQEKNFEKEMASQEPVDSIHKIEFYVKGKLEQIDEVLPVVKNYLNKFYLEIEKGKEPFCIDKREKIEGLVWIVDSVSLIAKNLSISPRHVFSEGKNLEETLTFMRISINTLMQGIHDSNFFYSYFKEGILPRIPILEKMIDTIVDFYQYLSGSKNQHLIEELIKEGKAVLNFTKEISSALQDGKDQDALNLIQKIMCYFEAVNIILIKSEASKSKKESNEKIRVEMIELFNQCYDSFKTQDIVSVSDIVEYEIAEKLAILIDSLKQSAGLATGE